MKKINVIEFELNIDQQRVIQKIVAPIQGDRGRPLLCSYFGEICQDDDASDEAENLGFREIWKQLPSEMELLSELENCTIKSSSDWICKSSWYRTPKDIGVSYIGKTDNEWISNSPLSNLSRWKAGLVIDQMRCGGNLCFVMSIEEQKLRFEKLKNILRKGVDRAKEAPSEG